MKTAPARDAVPTPLHVSWTCSAHLTTLVSSLAVTRIHQTQLLSEMILECLEADGAYRRAAHNPVEHA
jgi:hypothetical protein